MPKYSIIVPRTPDTINNYIKKKDVELHMYDLRSKMQMLTSFLVILVILIAISEINQFIKQPSEVVDTEYSIESIQYDEREVEYGTFTTKKEMREYLDVVYTNEDSGETHSKSFRKEHITIGDETKIEGINDRNVLSYTALILTKDEFLTYFHQENKEQVFDTNN